LTLVELLCAMTVMVIVTGVVAGLAAAVLNSNEHNRGVSTALQHGRVSMERIARAVNEAYATETHPGVVVVEEVSGSSRFPDMLVVWRPTTVPLNAAGPPLVSELVIFCPHPSRPGQLVEARAKNDMRTVSLEELNTAAWRASLEALIVAPGTDVTLLTPLLRTAQTGTSGGLPGETSARGAVRFERRLAPSLAAVQAVRGGTGTWIDLPWPQGMGAANSGLRQVWVRIELQLMPGAAAANSGKGDPLPFLGSAAMYYELKK
jgi:hypothetical protein